MAKFIPNWNCHYWVSQQTELTQSKTPPTAITESIMLSKGTWSIKAGFKSNKTLCQQFFFNKPLIRYIPRWRLQVFYVRPHFFPNLNAWVINKLQPKTTTDSVRTKRENMSTSESSNSNNTSLLSPVMDFPSRAEQIAVCSGLLFEALSIVTGNFVTTVFFPKEKELCRGKS